MYPRANKRKGLAQLVSLAVSIVALCLTAAPMQAAPLPGGTLDPTTIPKYVQPLVIPPEMPKSTVSPAPMANYDIAVRQFKQQILPGGIWNSVNGRTDTLPATTLWSYGRAEDTLPADFTAPAPLSAGISFNYPAFTVEATSGSATSVRWINDLVDPNTGNFLPHLFPVDQTLHWANPAKANCAMGNPNRTDCETMIPTPYTGPVPLVTHVHGAHVDPDSDGYPEAWWLPGKPGTKGIPASYAERGSIFTQADNSNTVPGSAYYNYRNDQPATTLWYHDHAMGMTRLNVYAGPAGFWLVRGGAHGDAAVDDGRTPAVAGDGILPGPAPAGASDPNFDAAYRATIREVPIAIQDRSFNSDGSLFYPQGRSFFDGYAGPFIGDMTQPSDISGFWNPEAFFNTMVVNGTTWPVYTVADALYRLRLLNGCNSRTLNLALFTVVDAGLDGINGTADDTLGAEIPFYQIGAEQGFLPNVVMITTGFHSTLLGDGNFPAPVAAPDPSQALLMGPAERADVLVDFSGIPTGTRIRMINTAPDAPFGGLPDVAADMDTTGQVMDFVVDETLIQPRDATVTPPQDLLLPAEAPLGAATNTRQLSLNELGSDQVCVEINPVDGAIVGVLFTTTAGDLNFLANCAAAVVGTPGNVAEPMGPREAVLGTVVDVGGGTLSALPMHWEDPITETPAVNSTEIWEIFNTTMDAHPIHLHLVRFQVIERQDLDPTALMAGNLVANGAITQPLPNELGFKDTVVAYPGQVTRVKATFDIAGLYVWHCHIVEHEDNEMMRPFVVVGPPTVMTFSATPITSTTAGTPVTFTAAASGGSGPYEYKFWYKNLAGTWIVAQGYSSTATWNWTTTGLTPGIYQVVVHARNIGSTAPYEIFRSMNYLLASPASAATLSGSPTSPTCAGTTINFTATASGGSGNYEYEFGYKDPEGTWIAVQSYSTSEKWNWNTTGLAPGNYEVIANVRNAGSTATAEAFSSLIYTLVAPPVSDVTLSAAPTGSTTVATPVTFTAAASGGSGSYEYKFWYKNLAGTWIVARGYSPTATWNWTTTGLTPGIYQVVVHARNVGSVAAYEAFRSMNYLLAPPVSAVTFSAAPTGSTTVATPVTLTAAASGGSGSYEYKFWYKNPAGTWIVAQGYSPTATWNWTTTGLTPGIYQVVVHARNIGSVAAYETFKSMSYLLASPASAATLSSSPTSPTSTGTTINFTATASGGSGNYEYEFGYKDPEGTWIAVQSYSTSEKWNWNTTGLAPGNYEVIANVRNAGSTATVEAFSSLIYTLASPVSAVDFSAAPVSPSSAGTMITLTAAASGGSGSYEYKFWYKKPAGTWVAAQGYTSAATLNWNTTGLETGTYQVVVHARNAGSSAPYEAFKSMNYILQ